MKTQKLAMGLILLALLLFSFNLFSENVNEKDAQTVGKNFYWENSRTQNPIAYDAFVPDHFVRGEYAYGNNVQVANLYTFDMDDQTSTYVIGLTDYMEFRGDFTITGVTVSAIDPFVVPGDDFFDFWLQDPPVVCAGDDATICEGESYELGGTALNVSSVLWTTVGDGTFDDETNLIAVYTAGPTDITNGSVEITLIGFPIAPCTSEATDDMTLTILQPVVIAGDDGMICKDETGVKIYPNPANDLITIMLDEFDDEYGITIHDLTGRAVLNQNLYSSSNQTIFVGNLAKGVYQINIHLPERRVTKKLVIQ